MRRGNTKFKTVAVLIIGAIVISNCFTISVGEVTVAWAKAAKNAKSLKAITFRLRTNISSNVEEETTEEEMVVYSSSECGVRVDTYMNREVIIRTYALPAEKAIITVFPEEKKYIRMLVTDKQLNLMHEKDELIRTVKRFLLAKYEKPRRDNIGGLEVERVEIDCRKIGENRFKNAKGNLWVDLKTKLPVQIEIEGVATGRPRWMKMVIDGFRWNEQLQSSEFELNIPIDYVLGTETKQLGKDEAQAIYGLATFAELFDGRYPSSLALTTVTKEVGKVWKKKNGKTSTQKDFEKIMSIYSSCLFYARLTQECKDIEYRGHIITTKDADAELMRWKISDSEHRVIYGDLKIRNVVDKEKLLDKALELSGARIPSGTRNLVLKMMSLKETDLIKGLGVFLDLSGGRYPSKLDAKTTIKEANGLGKNRKMSKNEKKEKAQDIFCAAAYYEKLVTNALEDF
ncbi:MAG: hypothetical protein ACYS9Y_13215 [Planctomycetota bacterium]|jgi:outer membrane lipoprotein-sorting protein